MLLAGRYELGPVIGSGGMADVHVATDLTLHRQVAVKLMHDRADLESERLRFAGEARLLGGLQHPGLVTVYDAGSEAMRPFIVMELVEGTTLRAVMADGPLPSARVAAIGAQLAAALAYAHGRGVVHRDVKPANVLLAAEWTADGTGNGTVKLADFGIARLIGDTVHHTRTGHAVGTAAFISPEQVGGGDVTSAADVYSLGLVLLEALTGQRAYPGPAVEAALARLTHGPEIPADLAPAWRRLLTDMTVLEPTARPTAQAVAVELAMQETGLVPVSPTPTTGPITGPMIAESRGDATRVLAPADPPVAWWSRTPRPWGYAAAGLLTLALVVVLALVARGGGDLSPSSTRVSPSGATSPSVVPSAPTPALATSATGLASPRATASGSQQPTVRSPSATTGAGRRSPQAGSGHRHVKHTKPHGHGKHGKHGKPGKH